MHALTVIGENDEFIRLLKIRNPYGSRSKREWQYQWKEESDQNKRYLSEELGMNDDLDGIFWMRFEDFERYFYCTAICHYMENY